MVSTNINEYEPHAFILENRNPSMKTHVRTSLPGPNSKRILERLKQKNGAYNIDHEYVHSGKGSGSYFEDLDGNVFLDFASQIASNPLGYNHPRLMKVVEKYVGTFPVKYGGQDFVVKEHLELIESLLSIVPKKLNAAFLINSGAEANENAMKIAVRKNHAAKFGISFENAWHGRTSGALSLTNSRAVQVKHYFKIPIKRLPYTDGAEAALEDLIRRECDPIEIGFVIMECEQGEGGYHPAPEKMVKDIRRVTRKYGIPLIIDEVQAGMGRTGKWWAYEHYGIEPDIQTAAKALQVAATIANKRMFPTDKSAISSTWGGGQIIDLAMGCAVIQEIKKQKLLKNATRQGKEIGSWLEEMQEDYDIIQNPRGMGLMRAFDLPSVDMRNKFQQECFRQGLVALGCGTSGIRIAPALNVKNSEIEEGMRIIDCAAAKFGGKNA